MEESLERDITSVAKRVEEAFAVMRQRQGSMLGRFLIKPHVFKNIKDAFLRGQRLVSNQKPAKGLPHWLKMLHKCEDCAVKVRARFGGQLVFRSRDVRSFKRAQTLVHRLQDALERHSHRTELKYAARYFDAAFYLQQLGHSNLAGLTPFRHYLENGCKLGLQPHPLFDVNHYLQQQPQRGLSPADAFEHYLLSGSNFRRTPSAFFHERWYLTQNPDVEDADMNPWVHYLKFGCREGRQANPVFNPEEYPLSHPTTADAGEDAFLHFLKNVSKEEKARLQENTTRYLQAWNHLLYRPANLDIALPQSEIIGHTTEADSETHQELKCAIHVHAYYLDVLEKILIYLQRIPFRYDLLVSTTSEERKQAMAVMLTQCGLAGTFRIQVVPNRGRDVATLLVVHGKALLDYDMVLQVHTKKTPQLTGGEGGQWLEHNLESLLPKRSRLLNLYRLFQTQPDCGVVFPKPWHGAEPYIDMRNNRPWVNHCFLQMGINPEIIKRGRVMFPAGNMFWFRPESLRPMLEMGLTFEDFPEEPMPTDSTLAHALERCTLYVAHSRGYRNYMPEYDSPA